MKQRIKKQNKRKAALFGIDDAVIALIAAGISAAGSIGGAAIKANNDRKIAAAQKRAELTASNNENASIAQTNEQQAINYDQNNEIETMKTNSLKTIDSQTTDFRCGGKRRMKRNGGNVTSNLSKLSLYI